jgi:TetR/AcrR family transcriptional regulator
VSATRRGGERRDAILQTLAAMLEQGPGVRITTAALAREVGVSEAALYRHFPSKARMFEGLLDFVEEALLPRVNALAAGEGTDGDPAAALRGTLLLLLTFAERNPGITRLLTGDALAGETDRLRGRVEQLFERIGTALRGLLRDAELQGHALRGSGTAAAALCLQLVEGRLTRFVRSAYREKPLAHFEETWTLLEAGLFRDGAGTAPGAFGGFRAQPSRRE